MRIKEVCWVNEKLFWKCYKLPIFEWFNSSKCVWKIVNSMRVSHWIWETHRATSSKLFSLQRLVRETSTEKLLGDVPLGMRCLKETSSWEAELWRPVSPSLSDPRVSYSEIGRCSVSIFLTSESVLPRLSDSATDREEHVKASFWKWTRGKRRRSAKNYITSFSNSDCYQK